MSQPLYIKIWEETKVLKGSRVLRDIFEKRYGDEVEADDLDENEVPYLLGLRDGIREFSEADEDAKIIDAIIDAIHEGKSISIKIES